MATVRSGNQAVLVVVDVQNGVMSDAWDAPRVVKSGSVWTSQGPGTALEFALSIVEELCGGETARRLGHAMLVA